MKPTFSLRRGPLRALALACLPTWLAPAAHADGDDRQRVAPLPLYVQECAACHVAYPVGMLPAASWQRLMDNLPRHFGTDASLGADEQRALSAWLLAHAGTGKRSSATPPPEDRISRSAWFVRKHDEVAPATWKLPAVKSAAQCGACHTRADAGSFREREIRVPR